MTIVSYQLIPPSSGMTNSMSGREYCNWTMSPDHATEATKSPLSRLRRYSLPVNALIWPLAVASSMKSSASCIPSSSSTAGS